MHPKNSKVGKLEIKVPWLRLAHVDASVLLFVLSGHVYTTSLMDDSLFSIKTFHGSGFKFIPIVLSYHLLRAWQIGFEQW